MGESVQEVGSSSLAQHVDQQCSKGGKGARSGDVVENEAAIAINPGWNLG